MSAIFVAGTDTNVGKTHVCGLLLGFLREKNVAAGYQKWAATGPEFPPADLEECLSLAQLPLVPELVGSQVVYHFPMPASPHLAAEQVGAIVDPALIRARYREMLACHELLIVEGVGGLMVPLNRELLLVDLLRELKIPTLLVAKSGLGTINHTLLSLESLRHRDIPVLGVVFSDGVVEEEAVLVEDNMRTIAEIGRAQVFGRLRRCLDPVEARSDFVPVGAAIADALGAARIL
ncbi:MAG: dethiobiotin synthase [Desulfobulbaceae bacterium]|nr:dethiobiotin synthase [Desulfobulbaceae bacterium]HIJ89754.1 dethiobiotin synthase [Deltaproteobacteria bacterium]